MAQTSVEFRQNLAATDGGALDGRVSLHDRTGPIARMSRKKGTKTGTGTKTRTQGRKRVGCHSAVTPHGSYARSAYFDRALPRRGTVVRRVRWRNIRDGCTGAIGSFFDGIHQRLLRFEGDQILPGDTAAPSNAGRLLLVGMTPAPAVETEFNAWYDTEHIPALARVPGVLSARRFRAGSGGPKYVALYHLASPEVVTSAQWKQASESTPMPEHIRPQISDRLRLVCRSYRRQG